MFDHLLESSHRDDSNKWSKIGFGKEIKELASIEIHFTHLNWRSEYKASSKSHFRKTRINAVIPVFSDYLTLNVQDTNIILMQTEWTQASCKLAGFQKVAVTEA